MASRDESAIAPELPAPVPPRGRLPMLEFFRTLRDNMVATYGEEPVARFAERLPERVREGEFTIPGIRQ